MTVACVTVFVCVCVWSAPRICTRSTAVLRCVNARGEDKQQAAMHGGSKHANKHASTASKRYEHTRSSSCFQHSLT